MLWVGMYHIRQGCVGQVFFKQEYSRRLCYCEQRSSVGGILDAGVLWMCEPCTGV